MKLPSKRWTKPPKTEHEGYSLSQKGPSQSHPTPWCFLQEVIVRFCPNTQTNMQSLLGTGTIVEIKETAMEALWAAMMYPAVQYHILGKVRSTPCMPSLRGWQGQDDFLTNQKGGISTWFDNDVTVKLLVFAAQELDLLASAQELDLLASRSPENVSEHLQATCRCYCHLTGC